MARKVAKKVKPHTISGTVSLTACQERVSIMFGEDAVSEVTKNHSLTTQKMSAFTTRPKTKN